MFSLLDFREKQILLCTEDIYSVTSQRPLPGCKIMSEQENLLFLPPFRIVSPLPLSTEYGSLLKW